MSMRRPAWAALAALFAWFAFTAWMRPLVLPDEGRYAGVAWEMLSAGQWSVPTLDGMPFFHKPPLFYWIGEAAMQVFGAHAWAARMPSIVGATMAAWGLFLFGRRWGRESDARLAAIVLATQPFFFVGAQFANLDMLVAGCISATVLLGAHAVLLAADGLPHKRWLVAAYAMAGLGLLAKGLIGPVLPAGVFIAWLLAARQPKRIWTLVSVPGLAAFIVVGLPWFLAMQKQFSGFYDYFVIYHHFQRFAKTGFNNPHGPWFYPVVMLLLALPWSLAVPAALKLREPSAPNGRPSVLWLMLAWLAVIVVFFSIPASKLVGYALPAVPPFAWLLARALAPDAAKPSLLSKHTRTLAVVAALLGIVPVVVLSFYRLPSARPMGLALREQRHAGEPVVMVQRYAYDLPFYARLETPPMVLDRWTDPAIPEHDDWRKELYDASLFDPAAGERHLVSRESLAPRLCAQPTSWVVASPAQLSAEPLFAGATQVVRAAGKEDVWLWKLARPASCGKPSAG